MPDKERIKKELSFEFLLEHLKIEVFQGDKIRSIYNPGEKNPSLQIYPQTNSYYCFSQGQGGDIIKFYIDYYKYRKPARSISFYEALKELQDVLANKKVSTLHIHPKLKRLKKVRHEILRKGEKTEFLILYNIILHRGYSKKQAYKKSFKAILRLRKMYVNKVFEFIETVCHHEMVPEKALEYLQGNERKLTIESIKNARIVAINNSFELENKLKKRFKMSLLIRSGFFNEKQKFVFHYHKILIPYIENDKVCYCRGRKFLNYDPKISKYCGLYGHNSRQIFNIDILKKLKQGKRLYLCEGEFDTLVALQESYEAIGFGGVNNIPFNQLKKLGITKYRLYVVFDNDNAGNKASQEVANQLCTSVKRYSLRNGNDLTEVYHEN